MPQNNLQHLFLEELKDVYHAENQILKALPKMVKAANDDQVRHAFEQHLTQTKRQVHRLDKVFEIFDIKPRGRPCKGMEGIIAEGKEMMSEGLEGEALDAALISSAQKVEHYEIATYGTLRTWAQEMGHSQAAHLLQQTLDEEGDTDHMLTAIAEGTVNLRAESNDDSRNGKRMSRGNGLSHKTGRRAHRATRRTTRSR
jgi:ferritin-like metal-binding protein YciE